MNALPALKESETEAPAKGKTAKKAVRKGKLLKLPLSKIKRSKGLSDEKKTELVIEYRLKARKLARSILRGWHARLDLDEVDSVVDLSLCEAVKRFNPRKGASFMTFLYYHLRGNLIRTVSAAASANSVPLPEGEALEGLMNGHVVNGRNGYRGINAVEVAEALCSHDTMLPDEVLFKKEMAFLSNKACDNLDALEKEVIFRIYMEEQQLMDIARNLGYSRCHISRVKKKALDTLYQEIKRTAGTDSGLPSTRPELDEESRGSGRRLIQRRRPRAGKTAHLRKDKLGLAKAA